MIKVEIERAQWDRGPGARGYLLDERGCRCALGFVAKACGVPDADILHVASPEESRDSDEIPWPTGILVVAEVEKSNSEESNSVSVLTLTGVSIINANDAEQDDAWIEAEITRLGVKAGIKFVFTGAGKP